MKPFGKRSKPAQRSCGRYKINFMVSALARYATRLVTNGCSAAIWRPRHPKRGNAATPHCFRNSGGHVELPSSFSCKAMNII